MTEPEILFWGFLAIMRFFKLYEKLICECFRFFAWIYSNIKLNEVIFGEKTWYRFLGEKRRKWAQTRLLKFSEKLMLRTFLVNCIKLQQQHKVLKMSSISSIEFNFCGQSCGKILWKFMKFSQKLMRGIFLIFLHEIAVAWITEIYLKGFIGTGFVCGIVFVHRKSIHGTLLFFSEFYNNLMHWIYVNFYMKLQQYAGWVKLSKIILIKFLLFGIFEVKMPQDGPEIRFSKFYNKL